MKITSVNKNNVFLIDKGSPPPSKQTTLILTFSNNMIQKEHPKNIFLCFIVTANPYVMKEE